MITVWWIVVFAILLGSALFLFLSKLFLLLTSVTSLEAVVTRLDDISLHDPNLLFLNPIAPSIWVLSVVAILPVTEQFSLFASFASSAFVVKLKPVSAPSTDFIVESNVGAEGTCGQALLAMTLIKEVPIRAFFCRRRVSFEGSCGGEQHEDGDG